MKSWRLAFRPKAAEEGDRQGRTKKKSEKNGKNKKTFFHFLSHSLPLFYFRPPSIFALHAPGEDGSRKSTRIDSEERSENHAASGRPGVAECGFLVRESGRRCPLIINVPLLCRLPPLLFFGELQRSSRDGDLPGFLRRLGDCQEKEQQGLCCGCRDRCASGEWRGK